jgi:hypothetical protein
MILIKNGDTLKLCSMKDLGYYRKKKGCTVIGLLEGDYPSLKSLEVNKKNAEDFILYLNEKIQDHIKHLKIFEKQLKDFKREIGGVQDDK